MAYDVATDTSAGRRRLRRVAHLCEAYGQRVQKSVFECTLSDAQMEQLIHRLLGEIAFEEDSLRIYRLREPREQFVRAYGKTVAHDLHDPLLV